MEDLEDVSRYFFFFLNHFISLIYLFFVYNIYLQLEIAHIAAHYRQDAASVDLVIALVALLGLDLQWVVVSEDEVVAFEDVVVFEDVLFIRIVDPLAHCVQEVLQIVVAEAVIEILASQRMTTNEARID